MDLMSPLSCENADLNPFILLVEVSIHVRMFLKTYLKIIYIFFGNILI